MGKSTVKLVAIVIALALIITSFSFVFFLPSAFGATTTDFAEQAKLKESDMTGRDKEDIVIKRLNVLYQYINYLDNNYKDEVEVNDLVDGALERVI